MRVRPITADVRNVKSPCEKTGGEKETMKYHNNKPADDINTLKMEISKQFVRVAEDI